MKAILPSGPIYRARRGAGIAIAFAAALLGDPGFAAFGQTPSPEPEETADDTTTNLHIAAVESEPTPEPPVPTNADTQLEQAPAPTPTPTPTPIAPAPIANSPSDREESRKVERESGGGVTGSAEKSTPPHRVVGEGESGLRLNFRGAPLEMVLDYLSEAAGFTIVLETEVRGKLDVWSNQPMTKDEAVELLNQVLSKNGYAALRSGRTLTILSRDEAKKRDIPVRSGGDPSGIPKSDEIITQIIPVRYINAVQLTKDLQPLFPSSATIASNEGGNAVVITDTQANIHRVAQIIKALDTGIAAVSGVRVFALRYADSKALATVIGDLFRTQESARTGNQQQQQAQQFFRAMRGGGPPGAGGDAGQGGQSSGSGSSRVSTPRVVALADERSNSLIVSAPEEQMTVIEDLVKQVDTPMDEVTELRVFTLKYADPQEMSELIEGLFPDPTAQNNNNNRGQVRFGGAGGGNFGQFGGGGGGGGGGGRGGASTESARLQKQSRVLAVPDLRTGSVVVTAARDLMEQITGMIEQLDADPAKKQKVFVYSVENTDPQSVEDILKGMFETQNSRNRTSSARSNTRQTGNQLNNRATTSQNQGQRAGGFNNSGFGNTGTGMNGN